MPAVRAEGLRSQLSAFLRDRFAERIAAWSEAGLDTAALLFFPLLVVLPRSRDERGHAAGDQEALSHAQLADKLLAINAISVGARLMSTEAHQLVVSIESRLPK